MTSKRLQKYLKGASIRGLLIVGNILLLYWHYCLIHVMIHKLNMNDFGQFYYSTVAFLQGRDMYGPNPATFFPAPDSANKRLWNLNPPHFHLLLLPLATFPPKTALALWFLASLVCLVASSYLIIREVAVKVTPLRFFTGLFLLLAFSGTTAVLVKGQVSFLLLLPVTLAWIKARRGQWVIAGIFLGLAISIKPFMLIFVPYLLLRRKFLSTVVACLTVLLSFAIGFAVFGIDSYGSWLTGLSLIDWHWFPMNVSIQGILSRALAQSPLYTPLAELPGLVIPLWVTLAGLVGILTMASTVWDLSDHAVDRAFALLLLGALLISPLGWIYYLWLTFGPLAVLSRSWIKNRNLPTACLNRWKTVLLIASLAGMFFPYLATSIFQPEPWATLLFGSIYFWSILALWIFLVIDVYGSQAKTTRVPPQQNLVDS